MLGIVRRLSAVLTAWMACSTVACGSGQHPQDTANTGPELVELDVDNIHPADSEASEAPPSGTPMQQAVQHALDARHAAVAQCYATALRQAPDAVGRIAVEMSFTPEGHVDRVNGHIDGEGGLGNARVCVETALRAAVVSATSANGLRVRRTYAFQNPPVEITLASPITLTPPPHGLRAPSSEAPPAAADSVAGPLSDAEVSTALSEHQPALQLCYGTALHASRNAAGGATLTITVGGTGAVSDARFASEAPTLSSASDCVVAAVRAIHFRASGTGASVHARLTFQRAEH
jgi:hypothetical protein